MATQTFTTTGTWVCPQGVYFVIAECWGGGGSGGLAGATFAATGGGGGAYSFKGNIPVVPGTSYTVTVGVRGLSQSVANTNGNTGNDSWFSTTGTVLAKGGIGGNQGTSPASAAGGDSAASVGDVKFAGGASGTGTSTFASGGGGGGSGGGVGGASGNVAAANTVGGATGKSGGMNSGVSGAGSDGVSAGNSTAASAPGGGSGGASNGATSSGAGGDGRVKLTWYPREYNNYQYVRVGDGMGTTERIR